MSNVIFSFECLILKAKPEKQKHFILHQISCESWLKCLKKSALESQLALKQEQKQNKNQMAPGKSTSKIRSQECSSLHLKYNLLYQIIICVSLNSRFCHCEISG